MVIGERSKSGRRVVYGIKKQSGFRGGTGGKLQHLMSRTYEAHYMERGQNRIIETRPEAAAQVQILQNE